MLEQCGFQNIYIKSLGTPFNVMYSAQRFFFGRLIAEQKNVCTKILARLAREIFSVLFLIFNPLFRSVKVSDIYTEGYGWKATKV